MSLPQPPVSLDGGCSVIDGDTLYVYTPSALLSLPLKRHGKWKELSMGEPVTGGACSKGRDGMYILGGASNTSEYSGYQRYSFRDGNWETLHLAGDGSDLRNRVQHGVVYLEGQDSFLVYAGVQNGAETPSTFLVSANAPYNIESFPPSGGLATTNPTLFAWDENTAAFVGASAEKNQIWTFSNGQWQNTGAVIGQAMPSKSQAGIALLNGADGSKILEIFDMSASPNTVTSWVIFEDNKPVSAPGKQIGQSKPKKQSKKARNVTAQNFPTYNGKYAGDHPRSQFTVAQDKNKLVAIAGDDDEVPVVVFDQSKNSWLNPSQVFLGPSTTSFAISSSTSFSTTSTATATASTTDAITLDTSTSTSFSLSAPNKSSSPSIGTIVGATVGSVLGLLAIIVFILLACCFKRRKAKTATSQGGLSEKSAGSMDQGSQPLHLHPGPMGVSRPRTASCSSLAIMSGKGLIGDMQTALGLNGASHSRNEDNSGSPSRSAVESTASTAVPDIATSRLTDENWGKYFALPDEGDSRKSGYSDYSTHSRPAYDSSQAPEIVSVDFSSVKVGKVEESPVTEHRASTLPPIAQQQGMSAQFGNTDGDWDDDSHLSGSDRPQSSSHPNSWGRNEYQPQHYRTASSAYSKGLGPSGGAGWRRTTMLSTNLLVRNDSSRMHDPAQPNLEHEDQGAADTSHITTWSEVSARAVGNEYGSAAPGESSFRLHEVRFGRSLTNLADVIAWPN
ncbi:hypothetical protein KEM54_005607 [Ascosphaera aggregata]|nr:hypothetical protein KEM54_005607 [Ascosphaera aggregata]